MSYSRRRRVFVETPSGLRSAGFTVPAVASAVDVSLELRKRGFAPYRLRFEAEQEAWIAALMDWRSAA